MNLIVAFKAFFVALFNREKADRIAGLLEAPTESDTKQDAAATTATQQPTEKAAVRKKAIRSDALTLLSSLQREARFVDLVHEELDKYSDAQVGAAARPCLQQCAGVLNRMFQLQPVLDAKEGESVEVPADASALRYQWIGEGSGAAGKLVHHGWTAGQVELPHWSGDAADANVVAPAQIQAS